MKISKFSGNVFVEKMMGCLNEFIKKYLLVLANKSENRKRTLTNHQNILAMIEKKDVDTAGDVTQQHLSRTLKLITSYNAKKNEIITKQDLVKIFRL